MNKQVVQQRDEFYTEREQLRRNATPRYKRQFIDILFLIKGFLDRVGTDAQITWQAVQPAGNQSQKVTLQLNLAVITLTGNRQNV